MRPTPRKPPDQPAVDRSEAELALLRALAHALDVIKNPLDLGRREIGVQNQAGLLMNRLLVALAFELLAVGGGPAVLPHDRVIDRQRCLPIPDHGRFTLIGDPYAGDIQPGQIRFGDRLGGNRRLGVPYFRGIVLDPSGTGKDLLETALRRGHDLPLPIDDNGPGRSSSLIQGEYVFFTVHFDMIFELSNSFPLQYVPVAQRLEAASLGLDPLSRATQLARHNLRHGTGHFPRGPGIEE